jgi:hypothetical protein
MSKKYTETRYQQISREIDEIEAQMVDLEKELTELVIEENDLVGQRKKTDDQARVDNIDLQISVVHTSILSRDHRWGLLLERFTARVDEIAAIVRGSQI